MSTIVEVHGVDLVYPVYSIRAQSLRNAIGNLAVGGKLLKDGRDIVYVKALNNITFSLKEGDRLGIIGHNGAGKSTLLRVLAGIYEPDAGRVNVSGRISSMLDDRLGVDPVLTGRENLINMGRMRGYSTKTILQMIPEIVEFTELGQYIDMPMRTYSQGMVARLIFGMATSLDPDVVLTDEWIGAGDKFFIDKATTRINDILSRSRIIVVASHSFNLIRSICNKLLVLESGNQIYFGPVEGWDEINNRPVDQTPSLPPITGA